MRSLDDLRDFDIDLRPRRTFDIEEEDIAGKSRIGVVIGFLVAGVFIFLKEALYGNMATAEDGNQSGKDKKNGLDLAPTNVDLPDDETEQSEKVEDENSDLIEPSPLGSGTNYSLFSQSVRSFDVSSPVFSTGGNGTPLLSASNDNRTAPALLQNPLQFSEAEVFAPITLVTPGGATGTARAVVNGDSVVIEGEANLSDTRPADVGQPGDGSTNPPGTKKNRAPSVIAPVTFDDLLINQTIIVAASQLLFFSNDADGDDLYVKDLTTSSGTLSLTGDDQWHFTPDLNYIGGVTFDYQVSDGEFNVSQIALLNFSQVPGQTIIGTEGNDVLIGTPGNDFIDGSSGHDVIHARNGDDIIRGGSGDDRIVAGDGDDTVYGGGGNDLILGGAGDDVLFGGDGNDTIFGEAGSDIIFGEAGDDSLNGGEGNDIVEGGQGNDRIWGEAGNDLLDGGDGEDQIFAGDGNDVIIGGLGQDVAHGGNNDDIFIADMDDGDDTYYGDDGFDTYDISRTLAGAKLNLDDGTATSDDIGSDLLTGIENVIGSHGDDVITGDSSNNELHGEDGNDYVYANHGDDILIGGAGDDVLRGEDGDDIIYGGFGDDRLDGKDGDDLIVGDIGDDRLDGDDGDDFLHGGNGDDRLRGEDGDDLLYGGSGDDDLEGNDGNDTIVGGLGSDTASGGKGDDLFVAELSDGDDVYSGDDGIDTYDLSQTSADAIINLNDETAVSLDIGTDQIVDFENATGGSGNDVFISNSQVNVFEGGPGFDTYVFKSAQAAGLGEGHRDHIKDFEIGDKVDLSFIDADEDEDGNQSFEFVLDNNALMDKGSLVLRYEIDDDDDQVINTIIAGFVDNDQLPDFEISMSGRHVLDVSSFIGVNFLMHA